MICISAIIASPSWGNMGAGRIASDFNGSREISNAKINAITAGSLPKKSASFIQPKIEKIKITSFPSN